LRDANYGGKVNGIPSTIEVDWVFETGYDTCRTQYGTWGGGSGWTGQPLYVNWTDGQLNQIKANAAAGEVKQSLSNKEIIVGSLCRNVYFINYETGEASRKPLYVGNPIKGTLSFDPSMNGNLYVGHGIPCEKPFGALVYNAITHKKISEFGADGNAWRGWGAYDASPLAVGQFVFRVGENGTIYKLLCTSDDVKMHSTLRYKVRGAYVSPGIESSMAVSRNYGFVADNHGNILAINLDTMKPVWRTSNHDDTDATIVVEEVGDSCYLYTGCELDNQGANGYSYFTKINGLTGEVVWSQPIECRCDSIGGKLREGGMFATPLIGHGDCEGMIFSNFCTIFSGRMGEFVAFDTKTGKVLYRTTLNFYSWSSPVAFYNEKNELFVFTGDTTGNAYLIRGKTGEIIYKTHIANNFESSPVVIGNTLVCGSRGREIYKLSIK
jgi:hypothetical protein